MTELVSSALPSLTGVEVDMTVEVLMKAIPLLKPKFSRVPLFHPLYTATVSPTGGPASIL